MTGAGAAAWADALMAARLFVSDPQRLAGVRLRARAGPVRDAWLDALQAAVGGRFPVRRLPASISPDRLLGGVDLGATLSSGRPVALPGLLAEADGGIVIVPMAERMAPHVAAALVSALDTGTIAVQREGLSLVSSARIGVVLLDEGEADDEAPPAAIVERLGLGCALDGLSIHDLEDVWSDDDGADAVADSAALLCTVAKAFGIDSARAPILAYAVARASAERRGHASPDAFDLECAVRLSLLPRARRLPSDGEETPPAPEPESGDQTPDDGDNEVGRLADRVVEAVVATLPPDVLAGLQQANARGRAPPSGRGAAGLRKSLTRGRPIGVRPGKPGAGARLHLVETLRAAAPWQTLRRSEGRGVQVRADDFRIRRFAEKSEATLIFVVDASGSAAAERLAETKGAVELLLAEAYVKRTQVALVAFRGTGAELVLAPTRSLVRAKKCLADLAGGGGTPLAAGVEAGQVVAEAARGRGRTPFLILMTDGRANVARDGSGARSQAADDANLAARRLAGSGIRSVVIDIAARPRDDARMLAGLMNADYAALPKANAAATSRIVSALAP